MAGVASNGLCTIASSPTEDAVVSAPEVVQVITGIATENNFVENLDSFDKRMAKISLQCQTGTKKKVSGAQSLTLLFRHVSAA